MAGSFDGVVCLSALHHLPSYLLVDTLLPAHQLVGRLTTP
jgi:hypothetical protein